MQARRSDIVRVADGRPFANGMSGARHRETASGRPLPPGHYFVLWPARARSAQFGRPMRYFGPFVSRAQAEILMTSALSLGIVRGSSSARRFADVGATNPPLRSAVSQSAQSGPEGAPQDGAAEANPSP